MKFENVLVFKSSFLDQIGRFQGISIDIINYIEEIEKESFFLHRDQAEEDPTYKQLIPYAILKSSDMFFSYKRGALLSEKRLLGNYSIGIGGHISTQDPNLFTSTFDEGLRRELYEELIIQTNFDFKLVGCINDDSNDVGKVHFGLIYLIELESQSITCREKSINETKFLSLDKLEENIDSYENWSKICIKGLEQLLIPNKKP